MIRLCIVDDHALVRAGLEQLLSLAGDLVVVGSAADGRAAIDVIIQRRPDVVLMDLSMPVLDGVAATRIITRACPGTRVLVLTSFRDRTRIRDALEAGAAGYLLKDAEPSELFTSIRAAATGAGPSVPVAETAALRDSSARGNLESR
jgi:DNA-binding NarL/FixJ family response regulator